MKRIIIKKLKILKYYIPQVSDSKILQSWIKIIKILKMQTILRNLETKLYDVKKM